MTATTTDAQRGPTVRTRILSATLVVVAVALIAIILITGRALFTGIEAAAATELSHEAAKLRVYAEGADGQDGPAHHDVQAFLTDYLARHVTESQEALFSIVDGRPDRRSHAEPPVRLDASPDFIAEVSGITAPVSGRVETSAGPAVYAAIPVRMTGDAGEGILVAVEFLGAAQRGAWNTVLTMAVAGGFALVLAASAGWLVAGRALRPIRTMREAASEIDSGDLDRRIAVSGNDDLAGLAVSFNRMLDRLQDAFDGQRRFLDDAGHELRTPITVIRGHLELMGDDQDERAQTLHLVTDELHRMSRLVDDLIVLARSERPDFLVRSEVDIGDLLVDTLAKATALGPRAWSLDAVPEGSALLDRERLTQALLQLAANAAEHTEPAAVIALGGSIDPAGVRVWVRDEGSGILPEDRARIFERFHRGSARRGPGSGLGLAIVERIAQAHGGTVTVRSAPGRGATFVIEIPLRDEEDA